MLSIFSCRFFAGLIGALLVLVGDVSTAQAAGVEYSTQDDEFTQIYELIDADKFEHAHQELLKLDVEGREADRLNLLGFTARKAGNYAEAGKYYEQALAIDPEHLGALEYQGELFITLGQIDKARENLAKMSDACSWSCAEEDQLRDAIEAATAN